MPNAVQAAKIAHEPGIANALMNSANPSANPSVIDQGEREYTEEFKLIDDPAEASKVEDMAKSIVDEHAKPEIREQLIKLIKELQSAKDEKGVIAPNSLPKKKKKIRQQLIRQTSYLKAVGATPNDCSSRRTICRLSVNRVRSRLRKSYRQMHHCT